MSVKSQIHAVKMGVIRACLAQGVESPKDMKRLAERAIKGIGKMSVAGCKATRPDGHHKNRLRVKV